MRLAIGCVQMLLQPGTCTTVSISWSRSPFGPPCRRHRNSALRRTASPAPAASATNGARAGRSWSLPSRWPWRPPRRSGRTPSPCGAPPSRPRLLAPLGQFLQGRPGERLDAAVEQLPVDLLLDELAHSAARCVLHGLQHLAGERLRAQAASASPTAVTAACTGVLLVATRACGRLRRSGRLAIRQALRRPSLVSLVTSSRAGFFASHVP